MNKFWCIDDVLLILKEGISYSDIDNVQIRHVADYSVTNPNVANWVYVSFNIRMPLEKVKDISMSTFGNIAQLAVDHLVHPELKLNGHYFNFNSSDCSSYINSNMVIVSLELRLATDFITETARRIKDSNFYSVLEAALED